MNINSSLKSFMLTMDFDSSSAIVKKGIKMKFNFYCSYCI